MENDGILTCLILVIFLSVPYLNYILSMILGVIIMMIEISDMLFRRLQCFAEPFVDTPESIISRALDALESIDHCAPEKTTIAKSSDIKIFNSMQRLPSLSHTRIHSAIFGYSHISGNWATLLENALIVSAGLLGSVEDLMQIAKANLVKGRGNKEKGFEYIAELGCSFQRSDANTTLRYIAHLAGELDLPFIVEFEWRDDPKAAYPGCQGKIEITPQSEGVC